MMMLQRVLISCLAIAPLYLAAMTGTHGQKEASIAQLMQMAQAQVHEAPSLLSATTPAAIGG